MSDRWTALKSALKLRFEAFRSYSHTVIPKHNQNRFLLALLVTGAFVLALPKSERFVSETQPQAQRSVDVAAYDMRMDIPLSAKSRMIEFKLQDGDNLGPLLQKNGLSGGESYQITKAFSEVYKPRNLRAGQTFQIHFIGNDFDHLSFKPNIETSVFVSQHHDGLKARKLAHEFKYETVVANALIENSLYLDATRLGVPDKVVAQFANIYEYSVDFQRDIQPGDAFEMFFEIARDRKGNVIKAGDLLYTSFSPRGKKSDYYLFEDSKGRENFYDIKGKTAKRKLRATPINGARLSSRFGKRRHPILGYRKMHAGVDFAAPRGTPILAAGSGTVERANRYGSYGNYIRIRHTDGYKTAYAHLSKFARGVRAGKYVRQDQVIGYVGTTGRSTGPHLHYEVHLNGKKINPRRLSQLSGKPLSKLKMPAFEVRRKEIDELRASSDSINAVKVFEVKSAGTLSATPSIESAKP